MAKKRSVQHIRETVAALFQSLGMRDRYEENLAIAFWDRVVGEQISAHTRPLKVEEGILVVKVDDNTWRSELPFLAPEIIEKLNENVGKPAIKAIKFY